VEQRMAKLCYLWFKYGICDDSFFVGNRLVKDECLVLSIIG
jgi:hypothetical protein